MLARLRSISRTTAFLLGLYVGVGIATFAFQTWVRSFECAGTTACAISFAKGAVWSGIWPASWVVYTAGMK